MAKTKIRRVTKIRKLRKTKTYKKHRPQRKTKKNKRIQFGGFGEHFTNIVMQGDENEHNQNLLADLHEIFNIINASHPQMSDKEIDAMQFKKAALRLHPDRVQDLIAKSKANENFTKYNQVKTALENDGVTIPGDISVSNILLTAWERWRVQVPPPPSAYVPMDVDEDFAPPAAAYNPYDYASAASAMNMMPPEDFMNQAPSRYNTRAESSETRASKAFMQEADERSSRRKSKPSSKPSSSSRPSEGSATGPEKKSAGPANYDDGYCEDTNCERCNEPNQNCWYSKYCKKCLKELKQ
jgi:hypothetical protein